MKTKTIPFDLETAKKIQSGKVEGRIVTKDGRPVRLICYDAENEYPLVCLVKGMLYEGVHSYHLDGRYKYATSDLDLVIEFPEEAPKHEFKVGDKIRVNYSTDTVSKYAICGVYQGKILTITHIHSYGVNAKGDNIKDNYFMFEDIEPYEEPKNEFKPFDKVLVRNGEGCWQCALFSHMINREDFPYFANDFSFQQCIPYDGHENLVGTTDKPKEE